MKRFLERILDVKNTTGSVEHYYHFFFAVLVPLLDRARAGTIGGLSWLRSCGPMDRHLDLLQDAGLVELRCFEKSQLKLLTERLSKPNIEVLHSQECYGPRGVRPDGYQPDVLLRVATFAKAQFTRDAEASDVLLIERSVPESFYLSRRGPLPGSAGTRRSIPNVDAIVEALEGFGRNVTRVQLEHADLPKQIALFSQANVVIAQHGAALANVLWMTAGSYVIEIIPKEQGRREHFSRLAAVVGAQYAAVSQLSAHEPVDPAAIVAALRDPCTSVLAEQQGIGARLKDRSIDRIAACDDLLAVLANL